MTKEERAEAISFFETMLELESSIKDANFRYSKLALEALQKEPCGDTGEISDGCHTFNQLYHQRAILFAVIVNQNTDIAWKSYKHSDGKYCFDSNGEWFIIGIDTPEGSYTYHYSKEYWDYFKCKELDCGKEWDGHTEEDVTRLLSLQKEPCEDAVNRQAVLELQYRIDDSATLSARTVVNVEDIEALPPVIPQPKIGKWVKTSLTEVSGGDFKRGFRCSHCNYVIVTNDFNFCPNCGAKMQEVK